MPEGATVDAAGTSSRRAMLSTVLLAATGLAGLGACDGEEQQPAAASATLASSRTAIRHTVTRLTVTPGLPYAEVVARYEQTVPQLPTAALRTQLRTKPFAEVKAFLAKASPVSLFIFWTLDVTPFMTAAGHLAKCRTYLMGNPLIAETMYPYNAGVMLHAPLRAAIFTDSTGVAHLIIDRPSDLFASFDDPHITATGHALDAKLVDLLHRLQFPVPPELRT